MQLLYQNGVDLYGFNYTKDALDKILEILSLIKARIIPDFEKFFHQLDVVVFGLLNGKFHAFTDDNCGLVVDFFLNLIFKILGWLRKNGTNSSIVCSREKIKERLNLQKAIFGEIAALVQNYQKTKDNGAKCRAGASVLNGYLVLYFHRKIGPTIFLERYPNLDPRLRDQITKIMDLRNTRVFSYTVGANYTLNLQFEIDSPVARGKKEYLQITLVSTEYPLSQVEVFGSMLEGIVTHLQCIQDLYKIFYIQEEQCTNENLSPTDDITSLKTEFLRSFHDLDKLLGASQ